MKRYIPLFKYNKLEECIILASKFKDGKIIMAKNRDRIYKPKIKIVHTLKNDVEIAYINDIDTGWAEGINEYGIGIVNTSLTVGYDEKEKKIIKKTGVKTSDGEKIIRALTCEKIEDSVDSIINYEVIKDNGIKSKGLKGHTFIANKKGDLISIELSGRDESNVSMLDINKINVRTNHGITYPYSGYTDGENYLSSRMRASQAEKISIDKGIKGIFNFLKKQNYKSDSNLNMNRDTDYMKTTGQIALNLTDLILYYDTMNGRSDFIEINNRLSKDYKAKIKIVVYKDKDDTIKE